tara:strand:- start:6059 stop:6886 length:828 start_codon:yes stop_codon:yes gene_type:complete
MKLAFSTNAYRNFSIEDSILSIKDAGYSAIELMCDTPHAYPPISDIEISKIKNTLEKNDMKISNLNGFMLCAIQDFHHPSWIEDSLEFRTKRIQHTKNCIILADKLNVKTVSTEPGGPITGIPKEKDLLLFENGIKELIPLLEKLKIKLLIEPEPDLLIQDSEQFLSFMKRIDSDFVKLNFDIGHFFCIREDPAELVLKLQHYIEHIHIEDISKERIHNHLIPGKGVIDFQKIFSNLEKIGYGGYITVELYPYLKEPQQAAKEAINYLKNFDLKC